MAGASGAAGMGSTDVARPPTAAPARAPGGWLVITGGLAGGFVAAGVAGTSTQTIFLGAVWAGTVAGILVIAATAYLAVRHLRASMPRPVLRQVWFQVLRRTVGWGLAAYVFWFLIVEPALGHVGIYVPMFP